MVQLIATNQLTLTNVIDGKTSYHHWAYSNNADGTGLTLTDNGQRYMGYYTDYTQADSTDKTKYRWADRWAKIEVGGKNILRNSSFANAYDGPERFTVGGFTYVNKKIPHYKNLYNGGIPNPTTSYHAMYRESFNGKGPVIEFNESNGVRNLKAINAILQPSNLSFGNYTFSADIYATGNGTKIWFGIYYFNKSGVQNFHSGQTTIYITKVNEWHRVSGAIKLNNDIDLTKEVNFFIYAHGFTTNSILYLTKPQLEEGTVTTPYGVSQQDIQADIDSKADKENVVYKTDIAVTNEGIVHSASKTVNGQTIASMIAQKAEWVEIIAQVIKVKADMIVDGAITGEKLDVKTLSAITSNLGDVTAGGITLTESIPSGTYTLDEYTDSREVIKVRQDGTYVGVPKKTSLDFLGYTRTTKLLPGLFSSSGHPLYKVDPSSVSVSNGRITFRSLDRQYNPATGAVLDAGISHTATIEQLVGGLLISAGYADRIELYGSNYTSWLQLPNGVKYKIAGDLVTVDFDVTPNSSGVYIIASFKNKLMPKAAKMFSRPAWTGEMTRIQVETDGNVAIVDAVAGKRYSSQVSWTI